MSDQAPRATSNRFEEIYDTDEWGHGSGEGSLLVHTRGYIAFLERFLSRNRIATVVDMGCGDWQFSRHVRWGPVHYRGYDIVRSVIARNQQAYAAPNIEFHLYSGDPAELPVAELLIVKDVLQHLSHSSVTRFLACLPKYKFALLTNCVNPTGETENRDIQDGEFRYLDLRLPPFNLAATELYSFVKSTNAFNRLFKTPAWRKRVLLVTS